MWKRTNEAGAFWSLMIGFCLGVLRMAMSFMYKEPSCGQHIDERPWILKHVHYMYYAAFLFWATIACVIVISKLTRPPAPFRLIRTTFWTRFDTSIRKDDRNVFEMKYSGATTNSTINLTGAGAGSGCVSKSPSSTNNLLQDGKSADSADGLRTTSNGVASRLSEADSGISDGLLGSRSSQQRLFTIEEQHEKKTADLSSVIVDINAAAKATKGELAKRMAGETGEVGAPQTAPIGTPGRQRPPGLQHQASLTASATAAVGEAGKFLASKFANTEANLRGARDMVMAAASHLKSGGPPDSRIKFKNLQGDDFDDDDNDGDDDDDHDDDHHRRITGGRKNRAAGSTVDDDDDDNDDDDDDDDDDDAEELTRRQRSKRNRRSQSVLSAALSSYKKKQRGGYQKALDEDEEDEEDDLNSKRARGAAGQSAGRQSPAQDMSSSTDDNRATASSSAPLTRGSGASSSRRSNSSRRSQRQRGPGTAGSGGGAGASFKAKSKAKAKIKYEEEDDTESGRTYRCLDNSVSLLMKTPIEEMILRIAVGAILLVSVGIFILLSLPPTPPPKQIADILLKN